MGGKNPNYGRIALVKDNVSKDYSKKLVLIENALRLSIGDNEEYRFIFPKSKIYYSGFLGLDDLLIINENNLVNSLRDSWIEGVLKSTTGKKINFMFGGKSEIPLDSLKKEYAALKKARKIFIVE